MPTINKSTENLLSEIDSDDIMDINKPKLVTKNRKKSLTDSPKVIPKNPPIKTRTRTKTTTTTPTSTSSSSSSNISTPRMLNPQKNIIVDVAHIHQANTFNSDDNLVSSPPKQPPPIPLPRKSIAIAQSSNDVDIIEVLSTSSDSPSKKIPTIKTVIEKHTLNDNIENLAKDQANQVSDNNKDNSDDDKSDEINDKITFVNEISTNKNKEQLNQFIELKKIRPKSAGKNINRSFHHNKKTISTENFISENDDNNQTIDQDLLSLSSPASSTSASLSSSSYSSGGKHNLDQIPSSIPDEKCYSYDELFGIYLHETSKLKFDYLFCQPRIRVSIMDMDREDYCLKSNTNNFAVNINESSQMNYIQSIISQGCKFKESEFVEPFWEELIIINENANYLTSNKNLIIFFELIDLKKHSETSCFSSASTTTWHHICWAFLKTDESNGIKKIDKRSRLQFYKYQKPGFFNKTKFFTIIDQWKRKNKKKYPATFDVTLKSFRPINKKLPVESNRCPPITNTSFESNEINPKEILTDVKITRNPSNILNVNNTEHFLIDNLINDWNRLPGQSCKFPNEIIQKCRSNSDGMINSPKGSLIAKFSPNGLYVAVGLIPNDGTNHHDIAILRIPDFKLYIQLRGHINFIYNFDWYVEKSSDKSTLEKIFLLSVSSDRMAILWMINSNETTMKILPHPCFVYDGKILGIRQKYKLIIITGGRDNILRLWKISLITNEIDLIQELNYHKNYITSIVVSRKMSSLLYTSDWNGEIIELSILEDANKITINKLRTIKKLKMGIYLMKLNSITEESIYVHAQDGCIRLIDLRSGILLQSFGNITKQNDLNEYSSRPTNGCFTISRCGSIILITNQDSSIYGYSALNGTEIASIKLPLPHAICSISTISNSNHHNRRQRYISSIDFHDQYNLVCVTVFGSAFDGGVFLLGHKQKNIIIDEENDNIGHQRLLPLKIDHFNNEIIGENQDLLKIIRRIDDIFLLPQNQTDDLKSLHRHSKEDLSTHVTSATTNVSSSSSSGLSRNDTFIIKNHRKRKVINEEVEMEEANNCIHSTEIKKVNINEVYDDDSDEEGDRTFILNVTKKENDDETYSIPLLEIDRIGNTDNVNEDSDDTTICESL